MKILGIETSCDETSVAIVKDGRKVLANVIYSQIPLHALTGGVVPEVAAREHVIKMVPVLDEALKKAKCGWDDIDAIAITQGPGLISSLIIGTQTANVISFVKNKPLIPVQHIVGHIYSNWLYGPDSSDSEIYEISLPALVLTVSGGHNDMILMKAHNKFKVLGETLDDAAGEAFDKVARILGLGYPGGPAISKKAVDGDATRFKLPRSFLEKGSLNFSFSGLKTAVIREIRKYVTENNMKDESELDEQFKADMSAAFQEAVTDVFVQKMLEALNQYPKIKEVMIAGGVSANTRIRNALTEALPADVKFRFPKAISYCTDNAAMIAAAGYYLYKLHPKKYKPATNIVPTTSFEIY
ncbi:tRNA (adenosine(37)-N6)-threonylcarbamoyltransferase complex transferase subunit TsaD [Candidatus Peregrinibacteria bacterium CG_4_10_14_0_2_um_filter_38_24]|nr:MAG: tRNA (adenosine(37)-N6)-threonylcarbamoyltransferase complex transferase subunit TsaD [Candidatus Peregrinibacteria bacterium CG_4_10_14_0_2_um_filter_38_24]PJC39163.1 MAG: tRNA (adenosine(37)-N6)-threonylcarbamoyltransferase complex transferase subunit TsaD [Candidatus Peregrinibacteria bacterium CG_4_9_14_0_2_um_filter_38_9]